MRNGGSLTDAGREMNCDVLASVAGVVIGECELKAATNRISTVVSHPRVISCSSGSGRGGQDLSRSGTASPDVRQTSWTMFEIRTACSVLRESTGATARRPRVFQLGLVLSRLFMEWARPWPLTATASLCERAKLDRPPIGS